MHHLFAPLRVLLKRTYFSVHNHEQPRSWFPRKEQHFARSKVLFLGSRREPQIELPRREIQKVESGVKLRPFSRFVPYFPLYDFSHSTIPWQSIPSIVTNLRTTEKHTAYAKVQSHRSG